MIEKYIVGEAITIYIGKQYIKEAMNQRTKPIQKLNIGKEIERNNFYYRDIGKLTSLILIYKVVT